MISLKVRDCGVSQCSGRSFGGILMVQTQVLNRDECGRDWVPGMVLKVEAGSSVHQELSEDLLAKTRPFLTIRASRNSF